MNTTFIPIPITDKQTIKEVRENTLILRKKLLECNFKIPFARKQKGGYLQLTSSAHSDWWLLAFKAHFFDFHCSNEKQEIFYVHQLVAYAWFGWKCYLKGNFCIKGETEVHHADSDPTNNHFSNLDYVSPQENIALAGYTDTPYLGEVTANEHCKFNNQGDLVKDPLARMTYLCERTLKATWGIHRKTKDPVAYQKKWEKVFPKQLFDKMQDPILDIIFNPFAQLIAKLKKQLQKTTQIEMEHYFQNNPVMLQYVKEFDLDPYEIFQSA